MTERQRCAVVQLKTKAPKMPPPIEPPALLVYQVRGDIKRHRVIVQVSAGDIRGHTSHKVSTSSFSLMFVYTPKKTAAGIIVRDVAGFFLGDHGPTTLGELVRRTYQRDEVPHLHAGKLGRFAAILDEMVFAWLEQYQDALLPESVHEHVRAIHKQLPTL